MLRAPILARKAQDNQQSIKKTRKYRIKELINEESKNQVLKRQRHKRTFRKSGLQNCLTFSTCSDMASPPCKQSKKILN